MAQGDYKWGSFGGIPAKTLDQMITFWEGQAGAGPIVVLAAIAREEHAAANAGEFDVIAVVMKCIEVEKTHRDASGGAASPTDLKNRLDELAKLWEG